MNDNSEYSHLFATVEPTKYCKKCKTTKPIEEFRKVFDKSTSTFRRRSYCRKCDILISSASEKKKPLHYINKKRDAHRKRKFGLSPEGFKQMQDSQGNKCAICRKEESGRRSKTDVSTLSVDHCHATGKIRGLLCNKCNSMLGMIDDDKSILKAAVEYLEKYSRDKNN